MINYILKSIIILVWLHCHVNAEDVKPIDPKHVIELVNTQKCTGTLFARVVYKKKLKWIHALIETADLSNVISVLDKPSTEKVHHNGPFGSTFMMKISIFKPNMVRMLDVRLWNNNVSYDWLTVPARSFSFNDYGTCEELSAHLMKMSEMKSNFIAADSLEELLDKISLGDNQVLSLKQE